MVIIQELREQLARIVFTAGFILVICAWFAAVIAAIGGALYAGWIILTEGRDGLLVRGGLSQTVMGVLPISGYYLVGAWAAAFVLGAVLCWIGARMSKNPGDPVDFSLKGLLGSHRALARLVGVPVGLCFVLFWWILRLDFGQALVGSFLLVAALWVLVEKHEFLDLSDAKSPLLVVRGFRFKPQAWFCGECNKIFYPAHWLVQADTSRFPSYVAQCPECKGGNTQLCLQEREIQYEEAEAKCNVCGAPPLSVACHRYQGKERRKERE